MTQKCQKNNCDNLPDTKIEGIGGNIIILCKECASDLIEMLGPTHLNISTYIPLTQAQLEQKEPDNSEISQSEAETINKPQE
jgi:hypothetical protein